MIERHVLFYLDGTTPVPCQSNEDRLKANRQIGTCVARATAGPFRISTVFLGVNHAFNDGPPLVFETMVFRGDDNSDLDCRRYATWEEALAGHREIAAEWRAKVRG